MRPSWDKVWLETAELAASRSLCQGGAGAVVVASDNRVAFPGYAGPPHTQSTSGCEDCTAFCGRHRKAVDARDPGYADCESIHAEQNALIHADRTLIHGGSFYISRAPCWTCEKMIRNSGVRRYLFWTAPPEDGILRTSRMVTLTKTGWIG